MKLHCEKLDILYQSFSNVQYDPYDDEYDDRDDLTDYKVLENNDEEGIYRHMTDRFDGVELVSDPSDSSSEEESEAKPTQNGRKPDFCEDPALIREQREAQRRGRGGARGRDVVGRPKGQGQDKNVQHNRDKKNVQKSSRANHNRKGGAQWKRSRGMMPSWFFCSVVFWENLWIVFVWYVWKLNIFCLIWVCLFFLKT